MNMKLMIRICSDVKEFGQTQLPGSQNMIGYRENFSGLC